MIFISLDQITILDLVGKDAAKIANNLCTADIARLDIGQGREAFVTEVKGKALGHVCIYRTVAGVRMIGAPGNDASLLAAHCDRYIIREDAVPQTDLPPVACFVLDPEAASIIGVQPIAPASSLDLSFEEIVLDDLSISTYQTPWWEHGAFLLLVRAEAKAELVNALVARGLRESSQETFHRLRIQNRYPWYGIDIDASNLPQEADRDDLAISFRKGCYLGQETIARLDSLGQVQKKLVLWSVTSPQMPLPGAELKSDDRVVGRITSVAPTSIKDQYVVLGFARRTHFDAGSTAVGTHADGTPYQATVGLS